MERWRICNRGAAVCGWIILGFLTPLAVAQAPLPGAGVGQLAQVRGPNGARRVRNAVDNGADADLAFDGVFLPPDRTAKRRLEMAEQLLADHRYSETLRLLGTLLDNPEDYFFKPRADEPVYRSLKAEASRLIAAMPAEGLESYELQFGARARQMLSQATQSGSMTDVAEVSRRFFFTRAGQEATFLLGRHHLDQNRPLAAALCFERLRETPALARRLEPVLSLELATCWLRGGKPQKARDTLVRLKHSQPTSELMVAGKPVKLFVNDVQALAWMEQTIGRVPPAHPAEGGEWALFRGDESRNATSIGGQPFLNVRWRQRTTDDRVVERFVSKIRADYTNQDMVALPSLHPLALGDVVVMRTAFSLEAVDFRTGKLIWRYPGADDSLEQFLKAASATPPQSAQQLYSGVDQRMREDAIYGTLSSDGSQIYFVDELGLPGVPIARHTTVMPRGERRDGAISRTANRLAARELRTQGKLKWEVGGLTGEDEPKLAGAFFLGPPLPLQGQLYALAEMKGQEIRLVVLSAKTGALEWSQQLAVVEQSVAFDNFRRNAGAVPSFADGVLVCPTSAGAIVAVDLTTRSLLWGYQYPRAQGNTSDRFIALRLGINPGADRRAREPWSDASLTVADGRVLATPIETDQLYCLNLADGKEQWKLPQENFLYVGCVHRDRVILVGRDRVSAVRLADGGKAWADEVELPSGSMPSGRGFVSGDYYYLPLTSAEVIKINLQTAKIEQRTRSRSGNVPGNLICHRDSVISQGVDYLDAYYQLDAHKENIARALVEHPDDPRALAELAAIRLDDGKLPEAIDLFRRSYALKNDPVTRDQFVQALLEGLRGDFAAFRGSLAELEPLVETPDERLTLLRVKALGLQSAGEILSAFHTYLDLLDAGSPVTLDSIDERLSVRRDRWIREQLERLHEAADAPARQAIDEVVAARMKKALDTDSAEAIRDFLQIFGSHASCAAARDALVAKLGGTELLERTLLLGKQERSTSDREAAAATVRVAQMLRESGRADLAAVYFRQLQGRFAQVVCAGDKTGGQVVEELPADDAVRKLLAADAPWPTGHVASRVDKTPQRTVNLQARARPIDLEIAGPAGPLFEDVTISFELQTLTGVDGFGEKRFRIPLYEQQNARRPNPFMRNLNPYNPPAMSCVNVNGGLMVLSLGNQIVAIDTLRPLDSSSNRVLWTQDLSDQIGGFTTSQSVNSRTVMNAWGGVRSVVQDAFSRRLGSIGPVNDDGVYFQRLHDLHCVDPLTGKTIWTRDNVGQSNDLFGDEELLFVAPATDGETLVLRAATGEKLGVRRVVPFEKRMATFGRRVLSWEMQAGKQTIEMRDVWQDQSLWSYTFGPTAKAALVGQEVVGVLESDGSFLLISLADGKQIVKQRLEPENSLLNIFLLRSREGYLLITNTTTRGESNLNAQPMPSVPNSQLVSGRIYAFERGSGKLLWPAPAVVSQHGLLVSQPSQLPALVFVRQLQRPGAGAGREPRTSVLCIDKRTGQVIYEHDQLQGSMVSTFELSGDPQEHTVSVAVPQQTVTLTFSTEKPTTEPKEAQPKAAEPKPAEPKAAKPNADAQSGRHAPRGLRERGRLVRVAGVSNRRSNFEDLIAAEGATDARQ